MCRSTDLPLKLWTVYDPVFPPEYGAFGHHIAKFDAWRKTLTSGEWS